MTTNDRQLLADYAEKRGAGEFQSLVEKHIDFVFASALRQTGDSHFAEDITQAVFLLLSQRAGRLKPGTLVKGWLFNTTRYVIANARRADARRKFHEREAAAMRSEAVLDEHWTHIAPHLDDALAGLPEKDRRILLLRFFENLPLAVLGQTLGISEQAAQKRVERALHRLRNFLVGRGAAVGEVSLASLLQAGIVQSAPAYLAKATIDLAMGASSAAQTSSAFSLAKGTAYFMATAKIKIIVTIVVVCILMIPTAAILIHFAPSLLAQSTQPAPAGPAPAPSASGNPNSLFTLKNGEIFKRIVDAPPDVRKRFIERQFPGRVGDGFQGHFIVGYFKNRPAASMSTSSPDYSLRQFVNFLGFARIMSDSEYQVDPDLGNRRLTGDILFKQDATENEISNGLTTFLHDEFAIDAAVAYRDVPRNVIVFHGRWKYTPVPAAPSAGKSNDPEARRGEPCIEIYASQTLDQNSQATGNSYTSREHLSRNLSDELHQQVILEAEGIPEMVSMRYYGSIPSDIPGLTPILQHIQQQTSLTWTVELRPVHCLYIEAKKSSP